MIVKENILLTGVTGNLGSQLLKLLLKNKQKCNLYLLIRAKNKNDAEIRILNLLKWLFEDKYKDSLKKDITICVGNIYEEKLGLSNKDYDILVKKIDKIYHTAALTRFQDPLSKQRIHNVTGTKRILEFILNAKNDVNLHYVSTIFVAGTYKNKFTEDNLDVGQNFNNPYEQSKFEAEKIVREFAKKNNKTVCIYRPSIIVGEYLTGRIINFQMFYHVLYLISRSVISEVPVRKNTHIHIIPVDIAAKMIYLLSKNEINNNFCYHIISPHALRIAIINNLVTKYFSIKRVKLNLYKRFKNRKTPHSQFLQSMMSYVKFNAKIECKKTNAILKINDFQCPILDDKYIKKLLDYAIKVDYLRK